MVGCWFLAIWILAREPEQLNVRSFFIAGVILGAALCVSIKTTFLVPALALGWIGAWLLCADLQTRSPCKAGNMLRDGGRRRISHGAGSAFRLADFQGNKH